MSSLRSGHRPPSQGRHCLRCRGARSRTRCSCRRRCAGGRICVCAPWWVVWVREFNKFYDLIGELSLLWPIVHVSTMHTILPYSLVLDTSLERKRIFLFQVTFVSSMVGMIDCLSSSIGHPPLSSASPVKLPLRVGPRALSEKKELGNKG
jgi:hypothetical protein